MKPLEIYRKRLIPAECILLKDDCIVLENEEVVLTTWQTLKPKATFTHGASCYFLKEGIKLSKFYRGDGSLLYWYCDIVDYEYDGDNRKLLVTDLLADVVVYPHGRVMVLDLDELAEASEEGLITPSQMSLCLRRLHKVLSLIYRDKFDRLQAWLEKENL